MLTREALADSATTGALTITAGTVVPVLSDDPERRSAILTNQGTVAVWVNMLAQADAAGGFLLPAGGGLQITHGRAMYAFVQPGTGTDGLLYRYTETGER